MPTKNGDIHMIQDLHSHTYYSFCGADTPEQVVETAIAGGIEMLGITDHNYGIGYARTDIFFSTTTEITTDYQQTLKRYYDHINLVAEKYADKIKILRGIEICTLNQGRFPLPEDTDISFFDYCLIENLDNEISVTGGDLFSFAKRCGCPVGVAHTDLFAHIYHLNQDPLSYFRKMAENNIFWEMNVNLDTIHKGYEHPYMLDFFRNKEQQQIIRESGVSLSIGFDGHRVYDYKPDRIRTYCEQLENMGIPLALTK